MARASALVACMTSPEFMSTTIESRTAGNLSVGTCWTCAGGARGGGIGAVLLQTAASRLQGGEAQGARAEAAIAKFGPPHASMRASPQTSCFALSSLGPYGKVKPNRCAIS